MVSLTLERMNILKILLSLHIKFWLLLLCNVILCQPLFSQENGFKVMFYNTENFFDTQDDSTKNDNDFLPTSKKRWDSFRFNTKVTNLYKTIIAVGKERQPDIVGLCEVENMRCLKALVLYSPLSAFEYRIIHYDSPDPRGIDVAMLYNPKTFKVLKSIPVPVWIGDKRKQKTRDILMVKGIILPKDTVFVFVNHWSSRMKGEELSEPKRKQSAAVLRQKIDSIYVINALAKIIIMGDFNDTPSNESITQVLLASDCSKSSTQLCNLSWNYTFPGTYKYKGNWDIFDQIIVSQSLFKVFTKVAAQICNEPFLLIDDEKYSGQQPNRTYNGMRYQGGFSDHLPVLLELKR
jgi:predicted extracellular nuclease